jgi:hypothetical protein
MRHDTWSNAEEKIYVDSGAVQGGIDAVVRRNRRKLAYEHTSSPDRVLDSWK